MKSVMKVVNFEFPGSKGICKNPLEASNFEKTVEPINLCSKSSKIGKVRFCRITDSFRRFRPTQMRTFPFSVSLQEPLAHTYLSAL